MTTKGGTKRALSLLLCFCLLISLFPAALALGEERIDLVDGSGSHPLFPQIGYVYSLENGERELFRYEVPQNGATVLIFMNSANDHEADILLQELNQTTWAASEQVNFIAVDNAQNSPDTLRALLSNADPAGIVDLAYYNEESPYLGYWYLSYIMERGNITDHIGGTMSYPYALIITEEDGQPVIRYALMSLTRVRDLAGCLAELIELDGLAAPEDELVKLRVCGAARYDLVQSIFEQVNEHRIANQIPAIQLSAEVTALAMQRAAECAVYYSSLHERPNGKGCFSVGEDMPLSSAALTGENIAVGQPTPREVMVDWINSAGHNANILSSRSNLLGVGCFECNGILYWVQLFANGTDLSPLRLTERTPTVTEVVSLRSQLELTWPDYEQLTLSAGEEVRLAPIQCLNPGYLYQPALLLPWPEAPTDEAGAPLGSLELRGSELVLLALAEGEGTLSCPAWQGQENAPSFSVTVRGAHQHSYEEPQWTWAEDHSAATALFTCTGCGETAEAAASEIRSEERKAPGCETPGEVLYTAAAELEGTVYTGEITAEVPALGHDWGEPQWTWAEDYSDASALFTCARCGDTAEAEASEISSEERRAPGCETPGEVHYTAVAELEDAVCTNEITAEVPALGHDFAGGVCTRCGEPDPGAFALDLNGDNKTDREDITALFRLVMEGARLPVEADLNGDGVFSNRDAILLFRRLAAGSGR